MLRPVLYSPEDKAVLEAAYLRSPTPNRDSLARIVERVSMTEKQVQVTSHSLLCFVRFQTVLSNTGVFALRFGFKTAGKRIDGGKKVKPRDPPGLSPRPTFDMHGLYMIQM